VRSLHRISLHTRGAIGHCAGFEENSILVAFVKRVLFGDLTVERNAIVIDIHVHALRFLNRGTINDVIGVGIVDR
jgi:hypothetical protein